MLTEGERRGYRNLCHSVLISAIKDAKVLKEHDDIQRFLESNWCESLCLMGSVDATAYRKEVARRMAVAIERSSPKRLKTYKLVEVLHDGQAQGEH